MPAAVRLDVSSVLVLPTRFVELVAVVVVDAASLSNARSTVGRSNVEAPDIGPTAPLGVFDTLDILAFIKLAVSPALLLVGATPVTLPPR